jgi:hypothetical protein
MVDRLVDCLVHGGIGKHHALWFSAPAVVCRCARRAALKFVDIVGEVPRCSSSAELVGVGRATNAGRAAMLKAGRAVNSVVLTLLIAVNQRKSTDRCR